MGRVTTYCGVTPFYQFEKLLFCAKFWAGINKDMSPKTATVKCIPKVPEKKEWWRGATRKPFVTSKILQLLLSITYIIVHVYFPIYYENLHFRILQYANRPSEQDPMKSCKGDVTLSYVYQGCTLVWVHLDQEKVLSKCTPSQSAGNVS